MDRLLAVNVGLPRDVDWRGHRYQLVSEGTLISEQRSTTP